MLIYLVELRARITLILLSVVFSFIILYFYKETILFLIIKTNYLSSQTYTYSYFIFTNVNEVFYVYLNLLLFICSQLLYLATIYHLAMFVIPALFFKEYIFLFYFFRFSIFWWLVLLNLLNLFIIPAFWDFFLSFHQLVTLPSINIHFEAKISEYLNFYKNIYYLSLFYFLFFILVFFFSYDVIYNSVLVKKFRKIFYFFFIFISTILSPPDVLSQICLITFTISLYEILFIFYLYQFYSKRVTN